MANPDIFAVLLPGSSAATDVFRHPHNARFFKERIPSCARKAAASIPDNSFENSNRLELTFKELQNAIGGIRFGTDPSCDVRLSAELNTDISSEQFRIFVDEKCRVRCHNHGSRSVTTVTFPGGHALKMQRKVWILMRQPGHSIPLGSVKMQCGNIIICISFPNASSSSDNFRMALQQLSYQCSGGKRPPRIGNPEATSETSSPPPDEVAAIHEADSYCFDDVVGVGGFGTVRQGFRVSDGQLCAAKSYNAFTSPCSEAYLYKLRCQCRAEFAMMARTCHRNVIQVFGLLETPKFAIIMEYYPDGNLQDQENLASYANESILGQLLDGLSHLHKHNIIHRDLKPENVLVRRKPLFKVVIADFGVSRILESNELAKTNIGTYHYRAPEVLWYGIGGYDAKVDIWSLGLMTYHQIHGWTRENQELLRTWHEQIVKRLARADTGPVTELLQNMVVIDPKQRWNVFQCLEMGFTRKIWDRRAIDGMIVSTKDDEYTPLQAECGPVPSTKFDDNAGDNGLFDTSALVEGLRSIHQDEQSSSQRSLRPRYLVEPDNNIGAGPPIKRQKLELSTMKTIPESGLLEGPRKVIGKGKVGRQTGRLHDAAVRRSSRLAPHKPDDEPSA